MEERVLAFGLLKKISIEKIDVKDTNDKLTSEEKGVVDKLLLDGNVIKHYDQELGKDIFVLTVKGKHLLFTYEYESEIKEFERQLENLEYNTQYLPDYIKTRNLDDSIYDILNVEEYEKFTQYAKKLQYNNVRIKRKNMSE